MVVGPDLTSCFQGSMYVKRRTVLCHSDNFTVLLYFH